MQTPTQHEDAASQMKRIVGHEPTCLFGTALTDAPMHIRPMSVLKVDDRGNFWFLSPRESQKNSDITDDPRVQLFFANTVEGEFLTVYGKAEISRDKKKIDELWSPLARVWFTEGIDDPTITIIKVTPEEAYSWEKNAGKMVSLIRLQAAAVHVDIDDKLKANLEVSTELSEN